MGCVICSSITQPLHSHYTALYTAQTPPESPQSPYLESNSDSKSKTLFLVTRRAPTVKKNLQE